MVIGQLLASIRSTLIGAALLGSLLAPGMVRAEAPSNTEDLASQVLAFTNAERARAGLGPVVLNLDLNASAQDYAEVLAPGDCFGHQCGPLPGLTQRVESSGYSGWSALGENVAAGALSPEQVVAVWMSSPGHRANMLNGRFTELGVGIARSGGPYGVYWTQHFGARHDRPELAFQPVLFEEPTELVADE